MYDNYPPGMTTADLIHVGELEDPYEKFYEDFEPTDEQMEDFIIENIAEFIKNFNVNKPYYQKGVKWIDLVDWYKEENTDIIEREYDNANE